MTRTADDIAGAIVKYIHSNGVKDGTKDAIASILLTWGEEQRRAAVKPPMLSNIRIPPRG